MSRQRSFSGSHATKPGRRISSCIFVAERPIILDGIDDFVVAPDVTDRSFFLHAPPITRGARRTEEAFWAEFERDWPKLLGR